MPQAKINIPLENVANTIAGSIVYPPGGRFGPRIQQDVQLVMLYTGEMNVDIDGRRVSVTPGHVLLLKPGHEETFAFSRTEQTWHRWIAVHLTGLSAETIQRLYALPEVLPLTEEMNRLLDLLLVLQRQSPADDDAVRSLGLAAIHLYPIESQRALLQMEKHPAVYNALKWIDAHYADDITLKSLSSHAGLSPEHLLRLFKSQVRTTPIQYLWKVRIDRAIDLLTSTGLTVTEVAGRCGFKTSHHLARLIKQVTGRTASEIRRLSWGGLRK
ncbi:helix-turn-helix domain-containing protein [Cohnella yongneupensis]|uniref:Helix-turn-helix domain-containing protein n=1 Tax=Cohnella yongneupensis TaxID=425006 RepID=A0ABW0QY45_9BACL